jgi:hypothetical protein
MGNSGQRLATSGNLRRWSGEAQTRKNDLQFKKITKIKKALMVKSKIYLV